MAKKPTIVPRKPTAMSPVAAEQFINAGRAEEAKPLAEVHELERKDTETKAKAPPDAPRRRRVLTRIRDGRQVRQTTVYLDVDVAKKLAYYCVDTERDQSQIVNELLTKFLATV